jgi:hypothetical protein
LQRSPKIVWRLSNQYIAIDGKNEDKNGRLNRRCGSADKCGDRGF